MSTEAIALARKAIYDHMAIQKDGELEEVIDFLWKHGPINRVLEIGVQDGGTSWLWTQIAKVGVISIDQALLPILGPLPVPLTWVKGDSHEIETADQVRVALNGRRVDFLFIDGDHSYNGVKQDFEMYSTFVRPHGIIAFHDIVTHHSSQGCFVDQFWNEIKERYRWSEVICAQARSTLRGVIPIQSCGIGLMIVPE